MNLIFKKATKEDVAVINGLAKRIWNKHYVNIITQAQIDYMLEEMYSIKNLTKQIEEGHEFTLVLNGEIPIGYISLESKDGKKYFLHKFYVEVDEHGKSIGSKLFEYVLTQMPTAESIELFVNRENFKSVNFYFKHGFTIDRTIDKDIGEGFFMNDFVMIKKINTPLTFFKRGVGSE